MEKMNEEHNFIEEKIKKVNGEIEIRKYLKGKILGKGGFAHCYEFSDIVSKKIYAAKILPKNNLKNERQRQKLISEIKIHKNLNHKNIVKFQHVFEDESNVYILLELCPNETMNELLKRRKRLTELEVKNFLMQIIDGLKYLHMNRIMHRDLKLGNFFINETMELKIGDFGLATKIDFNAEPKRSVCGTPNYIAPEILNSKNGYSFEADIWSIGVIIYVLIIGVHPFECTDVKNTYEKIKNNDFSFPDNFPISKEAKNLILKIFNLNPLQRPTLQDILEDPFLKNESIPKLLPTSILNCPPSLSYLRHFCKDDHYLQFIIEKPQKIIENYLSTKTINSTPPSKDHHFNYLQNFVDSSSKYGIGYIINNGLIGASFNDNTKIIFSSDFNRFSYFCKNINSPNNFVESIYLCTSFPEELKKKVVLCQQFSNWLLKTNILFEKKNDETIIFVKKWQKTEFCISFNLSNGVLQTFFADKSQIIIKSDANILIYLSKKGERKSFPITSALSSSNTGMKKRLLYIKQLYEQNNP